MPRIFHKSIATYPFLIRIGYFILVLLVVWLPFAIPIYLLFNRNNPNFVSILTMGLLYLEFIWLLRLWSQQVYQNANGLKTYGLTWQRKTAIELLNGLAIGLIFTGLLFSVEALLGWVTFDRPSANWWQIASEGLLISLGIGFVEELFFRGWLLNELEKDYQLNQALWYNALIFAGLHFLKPLSEIIRTFPQFPALVLLGLTLGWAKRSRSNRLGMSIGLHSGLVWGYYMLNVGKLIQYTGQASPLLTGIDKNPLAGVMGLLFLSILAIWMRQRGRSSRRGGEGMRE